eukprot:TRINITY_DN2322_c0_g1_i1.p1 TRINITY_DN2322_c0_g1~~TRINITY_DN2322_c0_g1_i1.p1  ORF type:complete len:123 (-),score=43.30 TRINITY_DN2322_c0_g1_i1:24-392(-)
MSKDNTVACLAWGLGLFGCCGMHRCYLNDPVVGCIYFFTGGVCAVGQLLDLCQLENMVDRANGGNWQTVQQQQQQQQQQVVVMSPQAPAQPQYIMMPPAMQPAMMAHPSAPAVAPGFVPMQM